MAANLESLVSRLEAVTTRLESVASQGGTSEAGWCLFLLSARYICCLFNCSFLALIFSLFASFFLPWVLFPTFGADVGVLVEHYDEVLCLKMFFSCYKMLEFIKGHPPIVFTDYVLRTYHWLLRGSTPGTPPGFCFQDQTKAH